MKSASDVDLLVQAWIDQKKTKAEIIVNTAEAELGWPYVWGAVGAKCTPGNRKSYAQRSVCPPGEVTQIYKTCQYYTDTGEKSGKSCGGCPYYPDNMRVLIDDCQGFCKQVYKRIGITLPGSGCTSMWNSKTIWTEKGTIDKLPKDTVCLVFQWNKDKQNMQHMGIHIGGGNIVECSGTVKRSTTANKHWTHYAIPKGMDGKVPTTDKPTLRKGASGEYVTLLQTMLIQRGYNVGATGADGKFGNATLAAVKDFQKNNGLVVDGVVGKNTWTALEEGQKELYTVTISHVSKAVAENLVNQYGGTMKKEG